MLFSQLFWPSYILQTDVTTSMFDDPTIIGVFGVLVLIIVGGVFYLLNQKNQQVPLDPLNQNQQMLLNPLMAQAQFLQNKASDFGEAALEKIDDVLDEYQEILPYLEDLGLKVEGLSIEVGLLPKIKTSLVASLDVIEVEAIERVKTENKTQKLLVSILNAVTNTSKTEELRAFSCWWQTSEDAEDSMNYGGLPTNPCLSAQESTAKGYAVDSICLNE